MGQENENEEMPEYHGETIHFIGRGD